MKKIREQMNIRKTLITRFETRQAVVGIVGLGYVGLPRMLRFQEAGFRVLGIDIDSDKV